MGELRKELIFREILPDHHADQNYDIILACYSPTDPGLCFDFLIWKIFLKKIQTKNCKNF